MHVEFSTAPETEEIKMVSHTAAAPAGHYGQKPQRSSAALGTIVMFAALSPMCAVCGFMLSQILGFVPY